MSYLNIPAFTLFCSEHLKKLQNTSFGGRDIQFILSPQTRGLIRKASEHVLEDLLRKVVKARNIRTSAGVTLDGVWTGVSADADDRAACENELLKSVTDFNAVLEKKHSASERQRALRAEQRQMISLPLGGDAAGGAAQELKRRKQQRETVQKQEDKKKLAASIGELTPAFYYRGQQPPLPKPSARANPDDQRLLRYLLDHYFADIAAPPLAEIVSELSAPAQFHVGAAYPGAAADARHADTLLQNMHAEMSALIASQRNPWVRPAVMCDVVKAIERDLHYTPTTRYTLLLEPRCQVQEGADAIPNAFDAMNRLVKKLVDFPSVYEVLTEYHRWKHVLH
eukprot:gnl/Chilomastix_cuspidata/2340.p3 GENE.gnl/Chilomastix_cuspidata/2340~~gnl/Chilomastix_cuspidata/2340.p3  ORF type:complete len:339 (+),score=171.44 gnl/Chilomastix_cuspidata/2340:393-1409(+)